MTHLQCAAGAARPALGRKAHALLETSGGVDAHLARQALHQQRRAGALGAHDPALLRPAAAAALPVGAGAQPYCLGTRQRHAARQLQPGAQRLRRRVDARAPQRRHQIGHGDRQADRQQRGDHQRFDQRIAVPHRSRHLDLPRAPPGRRCGLSRAAHRGGAPCRPRPRVPCGHSPRIRVVARRAVRQRAVSSVGQSRGLIILWSLVQVQHGLPCHQQLRTYP